MREKALRSRRFGTKSRTSSQQPASRFRADSSSVCASRARSPSEPEVLLMDEPTASLDPIATRGYRRADVALAEEYTIVVVTHNMQQAARVSDHTAFMLADESGVGRLIEIDETAKIFTKPSDSRTEDYITGRFG